MKDFIISILSGVLQVSVVAATLGGFLVAGNVDRDFNPGLAIVGALVGFVLSAIFTGGIFTLLRIKELLEEQSHFLREIASQQRASRARGTTTPAPAASPSRSAAPHTPPAQQTLRCCPRCNAIVSTTANSCSACGATW